MVAYTDPGVAHGVNWQLDLWSGFFLADFVKKITKSAPGDHGEMDFELATYYPIFIYLAAIVAFAVAALSAAHLVGPKKKTPVKLMPYESGMDP